MPTRVDRAVVDTNVLISAALGNGSTPRRALDALRVHGGVLLFADETFHELHSRLQRSKFDPYVSHERRATFLQQIVAVSEWVSITGATLGCRDPDDDKLLETAMLGEAECLITGDQDLLEMRVFRGIPILDAATFYAGLPDSQETRTPDQQRAEHVFPPRPHSERRIGTLAIARYSSA